MARQPTFLIYALTSPSGKKYVGLTSMPLAKRWSAHRARAATKARHPLYDAIRKYGADNFSVEAIAFAKSAEQAALMEVAVIDLLETRVPHGYNVSAGGQTDGAAGADMLRSLLRDPAWRSVYVQKLKAGIAGRAHNPELSTRALAWRKQNPRDAWRQSYRASRIARPSGGRKDVRFGAWGRLHIPGLAVKRARRAYFARRAAKAQWGARSVEEQQALAVRISSSMSRWHAENPGCTVATLAKARMNIDRTKQGRAASAGLKAWWAKLKADPEAYAAHFARRRPARAKKDV